MIYGATNSLNVQRINSYLEQGPLTCLHPPIDISKKPSKWTFRIEIRNNKALPVK